MASLDNLVGSGGEWLKGDGPESDIVISTRMRLARNSDEHIFPTVVSLEEKTEIEEYLRSSILQADIIKDLNYINLMTISPVDRLFLVERHLISKEQAEGKGDRAVAFGGNEVISIMVNEEDHLRIQVVRSGFQLDETWNLIDSVDDALGDFVDYAFSPRLGYLTACPSNLGTAMRASVMLHLPALVMAKQIEKVFHAVSKINLAVRGLYGEGTQASGNFYQISNQATLGRTERQVLDNLRSVVPQIISYERKARETLLSQSRLALEDRVWRAWGMLQTARTITSQEVSELLSAVRLGANLGILKKPETKLINELFIVTQPAHLQKLKGRTLEPHERDATRAEFIREKLGEL